MPTRTYGSPEANCRAAIARLGEAGLRSTAVSRFYETAPVPASDQPWFVNVAVAVTTNLTPREALIACLAVEAALGRIRSVRNAARVIDIDILDWNDKVIDSADLTIPHPRLTERAFALLPLADLAPAWRHPVSGVHVADLIAKLPPDQTIRPLQSPGAAGGKA